MGYVNRVPPKPAFRLPLRPSRSMFNLANDLSQTVIGRRPTARELVAGIAQAARQGLIAAWTEGEHAFESEEQVDGSLLTCCPAHDDHNPSFVLTDVPGEGDTTKLLIHCRSGCGQEKVIEALNELHLWDCPPELLEEIWQEPICQEPAKKTKTQANRKTSVAIIPVPLDAPPPPREHPTLGPITRPWEYRDKRGLICIVCRIDPNQTWQQNYLNPPAGWTIPKPDRKTMRPLTLCEDEHGHRRWRWRAPESNMPLYNSDKLASALGAKVIACEGEKAADAAQTLFPDLVVVTWSGGAKAVAKTVWEPLADREVTIWPDHDGAGSAAAQAVIKELRRVGSRSVSMIDVKALASINPQAPDGSKREPPPKWDAADAILEWTDHDRLRQEVDHHTSRVEDRVRLPISPDNIGETVDKAEEVLKTSPLRIYRRGEFIVRVCLSKEKRADGQTQHVLVAQTLNPAGLGEALEGVIRFERFNARGVLKPSHASDLLLKTFLERGKRSSLEPLTGITDVPLVRKDGSLLDAPGYDALSGIYYWPSGLTVAVPAEPTLDDARQAIKTLKGLIRGFPFLTEVDASVAISAFVSAVTRQTLPTTPLHAITATTPGSGKSLLATAITLVATGSLPSYITQGQTDEELEKRVSAQMLEGRPIINIDNCNRPLQGAALCNLLTAERVSLRILGLSKTSEIASSSFILVNGNNLRFAGDMVRRTVISYIDPDMERPETREFNWDITSEARKNRGKYVSACITMMRAFRAAGAPKQTTPLGSFEDWSKWVRDALIWAGLPDPCGNAHKLRDADPEMERFVAVADQWKKHFGNEWRKVAEVITKSASAEDLKMALMSVAGVARDLNANRLASFLSRHKGRPIEGFKFGSRPGHGGTKLWRLEP